MELPLLPLEGWKLTFAVCGSDTEEDCEEKDEEDGHKVGESEVAERLFWRGRVILSYTGAAARLQFFTCR